MDRMDKVNVMLADRCIDAETAVRVRMYFHHARALHRVREYRELEAMMSLKLRGEVASAAQRGWVVVDMKQDWNRVYPVLPQ